MELVHARDFTADQAWGSRELLPPGPHQARLYWTDQPFRWHRNTGRELFLVLDGEVRMHYREAGRELSVVMRVGDAAVFGDGEEHVAHPLGAARLLVVEQPGSD